MRLPGLWAQETPVARQARLGALTTATALFAAAAGLEAQLQSNVLLACIPGAVASAVLASRSVPSLAWTEPLALDVDFEVRPSPGRGEGLFALRPIKRGTFIMDYLGEEMDLAELEARYGADELPDSSGTAYLVGLEGVLGLEPLYVDGVDPALSNPARYMNHEGAAWNVRKVKQRFPIRRLRYYARRDIGAEEELTWDYGPLYWQGRERELTE